MRARLRFKVKECSLRFIDDAQAALAHLQTVVDVFVAIPVTFVQTAELEIEFPWRRKTRPRHDLIVASFLGILTVLVGLTIPHVKWLHADRAIGPPAYRHTGVLNRAVRKEQLCSDDPDRGIFELTHDRRQPLGDWFRIVVQQNEDASARSTGTLVVRACEAKVRVVADHTNPRKRGEHVLRVIGRRVVDDNHFTFARAFE